MAFVALTSHENDRVSLRHLEDAEELAELSFECQACGWPMYIRGGGYVRRHFAHFPGYPTNCPYFMHDRMTDRHDEAKLAIIKYLSIFGSYSSANFVEEYYIRSVNRIADVYVMLPDGRKEVHEAQLSLIPFEDIVDRTGDYMRAGVAPVTWWLGGPMLANSSISDFRSYFDPIEACFEYVDFPVFLQRPHLWRDQVAWLEVLTSYYAGVKVTVMDKKLSWNGGDWRQRQEVPDGAQ